MLPVLFLLGCFHAQKGSASNKIIENTLRPLHYLNPNGPDGFSVVWSDFEPRQFLFYLNWYNLAKQQTFCPVYFIKSYWSSLEQCINIRKLVNQYNQYQLYTFYFLSLFFLSILLAIPSSTCITPQQLTLQRQKRQQISHLNCSFQLASSLTKYFPRRIRS